VASSEIDITKAQIKIAVSKIKDFIGRDNLTIVFIYRGKHGVEVTKNHPRTARIPTP
jgi:hypothetical protein